MQKTATIKLVGSSETIAAILTTMLEHGASLAVEYTQQDVDGEDDDVAMTNGARVKVPTTNAFRRAKRVTLAVDTDEVPAGTEGVVVSSERRGRGHRVEVRFGRKTVTVPGSWLR